MSIWSSCITFIVIENNSRFPASFQIHVNKNNLCVWKTCHFESSSVSVRPIYGNTSMVGSALTIFSSTSYCKALVQHPLPNVPGALKSYFRKVSVIILEHALFWKLKIMQLHYYWDSMKETLFPLRTSSLAFTRIIYSTFPRLPRYDNVWRDAYLSQGSNICWRQVMLVSFRSF